MHACLLMRASMYVIKCMQIWMLADAHLMYTFNVLIDVYILLTHASQVDHVHWCIFWGTNMHYAACKWKFHV